MDRATVTKLQRTRADPAVSILMPTQRRRPGNAEDPILLRDLVHDAEHKLVDTYGRRDAGPLVRKLEAAARAADLDHPGDGLAIFAGDDVGEVFVLDFPVPPRVVVSRRFETRDLVRGLARRPRYRVLVLSEKPSRLFDATGSDLHEIRRGGFPLTIEGAQGEPLASGGQAPHTARSNQQLLDFFRRVDRAIDAAVREPRALVLVGPERDLAYFGEVTTHGDLVIGRLAGNHALTDERAFAELVRPAIEAHMRAQQAAAARRLADAAGAGRLALGIEDVVRRASEGRGDLLAVEEGFEVPAPRDTGATPTADVIDEAIEAVLEHGGDVIFMDPATLGEHAPIALALRW